MKMSKDEKQQESYSSMVNGNAILLSFEGWIKYVEGFTRGLGSSKTVDSMSVLDCVGEILEYMQTVRKQLAALLIHCEECLEQNEKLVQENQELKALLQDKLECKDGKDLQEL